MAKEQLSFECRKAIGCALLHYTIGLENSRHFFIQSKVKPKPMVTRPHTAFSRALRQLHVVTSSFDWFTVLFVSFATDINYISFGFTSLSENRSILK